MILDLSSPQGATSPRSRPSLRFNVCQAKPMRHSRASEGQGWATT
jgi:hypothetical protein